MAQEMTQATAVAAAGLVGIISIANGAGRLLWAWASDFTGRRQIFVVMFLLQAVLFVMLSRTESFGGTGAARLHRPPVLRRRIRHDAGLRRRSLRPHQRRRHLRPDAHRLGHGRRARADADRRASASARATTRRRST